MKPNEFLKYQGRYRICETCNWDISEIVALYSINCKIKNPNQLSVIAKQYKIFVENFKPEEKYTVRMTELRTKLGDI